MRLLHPVLVRLRRVLPTAGLAAAVLALVACGGGGGDSTAPTTTTDDPAAVTRLQWAGPAPLFTASGQQHALQVQALGAQGQVLNVPVVWQSSAPGVVSVAAPAGGTTGAAATLTAQATTGSAVLTATVGSRSLSAVALVVAAAPGTVVLADAQLSGEPVASPATLAAGRLQVGSTYSVTLQAGVSAPAVGSLVLGQGSKAVAGEVVAVDGAVLTLAMVPLQRLLPQLQLDLDLPLQAAPARTLASRTNRKQALAETSFDVAGFACEAEGSAGGVELAKKEVVPTGLDSLRYRVLWNSQRQLLRLSGQPGVQFEVEPTAKIAFTGKVDCKLELADIPIPLPPSVGLFLGVGFPVGVGFTLEGALPVNGVALNLKGQAQAEVVLGFDCNPGCASLNSITPSGSVTPTVTTPEFTANRLELSGQVYAWASFEGGARWSSTLQFDAIEAQAGLKFATTLATENAQAKDAASAGDYKLSFEAAAAPTEALGEFADLVGLILDEAKFETSVPLGRSPTASFSADKTRFKALDDVQFQLDLNSDEVLFPLQGYNVQAVRVYRKTVADDGSFVLTLVGEQRASSGQTQFSIPWLATVDSGPNISFVAFVQTRLLGGLRWQLGLMGTGSPAPAVIFSPVGKPDGTTYDSSECLRDERTGLVWEGATYTGRRSADRYFTNLVANGDLQVYAGSDGTAAIYRAPTEDEVNADDNSIGYQRYVNGLGLCGSSSWRLPTEAEVRALTAPTSPEGYAPEVMVLEFDVGGNYWTSTTQPGDPRSAITFGYSFGRTQFDHIQRSALNNHVRLVH